MTEIVSIISAAMMHQLSCQALNISKVGTETLVAPIRATDLKIKSLPLSSSERLALHGALLELQPQVEMSVAEIERSLDEVTVAQHRVIDDLQEQSMLNWLVGEALKGEMPRPLEYLKGGVKYLPHAGTRQSGPLGN